MRSKKICLCITIAFIGGKSVCVVSVWVVPCNHKIHEKSADGNATAYMFIYILFFLKKLKLVIYFMITMAFIGIFSRKYIIILNFILSDCLICRPWIDPGLIITNFVFNHKYIINSMVGIFVFLWKSQQFKDL